MNKTTTEKKRKEKRKRKKDHHGDPLGLGVVLHRDENEEYEHLEALHHVRAQYLVHRKKEKRKIK